VAPLGLHAFRDTCVALLIANGTSPLQLQRWMGHHSAAYTLETYGHLIDGEVGPALNLQAELREPRDGYASPGPKVSSSTFGFLSR
jgi:integrase